MFTNTKGQLDIVIHKTNIWNKLYLCKQTFFYKKFGLIQSFWEQGLGPNQLTPYLASHADI